MVQWSIRKFLEALLDKQYKDYLKNIITSENEQIRKLHEAVTASIKDENLLTLATFGQDTEASFGDRLADKMANFGGSWKFIIVFSIVVFAWIAINSYLVLSKPYDPYPFILLNLVLSCLASLQAPIIMMSQNRKDSRDRKRSENDYLVNLKAEIEIRTLHQKIDMLMLNQFTNLLDIQKEQLAILNELKQQEKSTL